jgi:hypothetical protein
MTIVERARLCVATRPPAIEGQGGNATTFSVAALLVWGFGLAPGEAMPLMLEYNARCEPPWPERELVRMLENALKRGGAQARGHLVGEGEWEKGAAHYDAPKPKRPRKKELELERLKEAQEPALTMDMAQWRHWLRAKSAVDPRAVTPDQYLDGIFRPGERVLVFNQMWKGQGDYGRVIGERTMLLDPTPGNKHRRLERLPDGSKEGMTFLMQPVDGKWHPVCKAGGKVELSRRSEQSVTRWPHILLESDKAPLEQWLNVIVRARIRIVSITSSAGRSLHAVVRLDKDSKQELLAELQHEDSAETLAVLGCDPQAAGNAMTSPRLPNTWREGKRMGKFDSAGKPLMRNGRREMEFVPFRDGPAMQRLLYFNPSPEIGRSIVEGVTFEHGE